MVNQAEVQEDKRRRILVAARQLLAERGYDDVSMAEVATRAGVAKGTVYLYYSSKAELVRAISFEVRGQLLAAVRAAQVGAVGLAAVLSAMVRAAVTVATAHRDVIRLLNSDILTFRADGSSTGEGLSPLAAMLRQAADAGEIPPDIDVDVAAGLVDSVIERLARATMSEYVDDLPRLDHVVEQTVTFLLRGLGASR